MKKVIPYSVPYSIPLLALAGIHFGGFWVLAGLIFAFVIHPLLDLMAGKTEDMASVNGENATLFSLLLWIYVPLQAVFLSLIFYWVSVRSFTGLELIGITLSAGAVTGALGITIAHELVHRRERWERGLGVALLAMVNYSHFRVEHVFGHHKHVATPLDPASARAGESVYTFIVRSIIGSFISAWKIESKRKSFIKNRIVHYIAVAIILASFIYAILGTVALAVYLGQSLFAVIILEAINYIEHYGLEREEIRPGVYASVTELHSWDSTHKFTNLFLFNLGRHAHHHASPTVPYQELHAAKVPNTLRHGYSLEILLAFIGKNTRTRA